MLKKSNQNSQWSEIPPEILLKIGELTRNPFHQTQFRAVCNPWRSAFARVGNNKNFPLKIPYHPSLGFSCFGIAFNEASLFIVPTISYMIQPTKGSLKGSTILVTVDEINPGYVSPRYPLSGSHCGFLSVGKKEKELDLLESRVLFVNPGFSLRLLHARRNVSERDGRENELNFRRRERSEKGIVLENCCCGDDLVIMVLCNGEKLMGLRVRDGEWKAVFDGEASKCSDVVKFKEGIYGIDYLGRAFIVDYDFEIGEFNIVDVALGIEGSGRRVKRLVVDSSSYGRLYMVVLRSRRSSFMFSVYGLNEEVGVWEEVESIEDKMFFVGVNFSFSATSRDFPELARSCMRSEPQNCIFFGKGSFPRRPYEENGDGDELLFDKNIEGTGMNIGQYYLGDRRATGISEPTFAIMFSHPM